MSGTLNTYCITKLPVVITVIEVIFDEAYQVSFATHCVLPRHRVEAVEKSLMISFHFVLLIIKEFILPDSHNHNYVMHWFFLFSTAACFGCLRQSLSDRDLFAK
jgi:hypothetical protein